MSAADWPPTRSSAPPTCPCEHRVWPAWPPEVLTDLSIDEISRPRRCRNYFPAAAV